ncbi:Hypothetical protein P9303_27021 [Prochlorococcus marinus str. MIT 9303]|uniref:Coenzyme PQQ synthesis protein D (PqqD) n=2 Tax=Prochlorococcus marinus TaxID=1219 RepID=A2CD72_PROM3|nr:Hypothetical protein P9303_27021 [Prochlorococcus marinus str. MIT 9303]
MIYAIIDSIPMMNFQSLMVSSSKRFKQHHEAVFTELDGEVALFQSNTCDYLVLNETGSAIWNALKNQPSLPELCKYLQAKYEVTPDECKTSVEAWLEAALEKKVITQIED